LLSFLTRRIAAGLVVLLGATFIIFVLVSLAADPLAQLYTSSSPNKWQQMASITAKLDLNTPVVLRYFKWLGSILAYAWGNGTFGVSIVDNATIASQLAAAVPTTVRLVFGSAILAIVLGVAVGIITALRQYSAFDYTTTFFTFLFYSLPAFWVAVLLKEFGAIRFNNFLNDPRIPPGVVVGVGLVVGVVAAMVAVGKWQWRALTGLVAGGGAAGVMIYIIASGFLLEPGLGIVGVGLTGLGVAVVTSGIVAGFANRRALLAACTAVGLGVALYYPLQYAFANTNWLIILVLWLSAGLAGVLIGWFWGGPDKGVSARVAAVTAMGMAIFVFVDRMFQAWPAYISSPRVDKRPIGTIGAVTPELGGSFWFGVTDMFTHLVLPTTALVLITFASYTRYTRTSMLEVMNADYIRTARAKGLSERVVVVRHAFRNALIPLATVVPIDIAMVFGGAIITEKIFSWRGMGTMFITALGKGDIYGVMGYFLITAVLFVAANIVADMVYASLDPRIRLTS